MTDEGRASTTELPLVTSRDIELGRVGLASELAVHRCPACAIELADRYYFDCPECGREGQPASVCRHCAGPLRFEPVKYVAHGPDGGSVSKVLTRVACPTCAAFAIEEQQLDALDAVAELCSEPLELLPEAGIFTPHKLEVLADADVCGAGEPEELVKRRAGMVLRIGGPSELFAAALGVVTEHDPEDIFSPTLSLEPGPPYSPAQRRTFQLLLADIQLELGAPVSCWSASVGLSEEPLVDPVLTEQLMRWTGDADGAALALYHAVTSGGAPGRFINSVRLLARVLQLDGEQGLAEALSSRLEAMARPPLELLQRLWLAMHPGLVFDQERLYASMQAFHARYAATGEPGQGVPLPWEEPDFNGYAACLRSLTSALLAESVDDGDAGPEGSGEPLDA
jgi:hypothetical protein